MFSQASLVRISSVIASTFSHTCDVYEFVSSTSLDGSTAFVEKLVYSQLACRLSFSTPDVARDTSVASGVSQVVMLFLAPNVGINPGSKFVVFYDGNTSVFENSSPSALYSSHQQIKLRLATEWA